MRNIDTIKVFNEFNNNFNNVLIQKTNQIPNRFDF